MVRTIAAYDIVVIMSVKKLSRNTNTVIKRTYECLNVINYTRTHIHAVPIVIIVGTVAWTRTPDSRSGSRQGKPERG